jgi:hypothetical protein
MLLHWGKPKETSRTYESPWYRHAFQASQRTELACARRGEVAQLAEHATENRGVGSSILPLATRREDGRRSVRPQTYEALSAEVLTKLLLGTLKESLDLVCAVATVAAQRPDRGKLPGLGPPGNGLRVDPEECRNLSRRKEGIVFLCLHPCLHSEGIKCPIPAPYG